MALCTTCGTETAAGTYCTNCGERAPENGGVAAAENLSAPAVAISTAETSEAPAAAPAQQQPTSSAAYQQLNAPKAQPNSTNLLAIVSLVSIIGLWTAFLGSIAGIVCGHIALSQIKRTQQKGRGLALAGLIIGYVTIGGFLAIFFGGVIYFSVPRD
jgi:hypothetical protein